MAYTSDKSNQTVSRVNDSVGDEERTFCDLGPRKTQSFGRDSTL